MKYYFIINPVAGSGQSEQIIPKIKDVCEGKFDYEIILTQYEHQAIEIVRKIGESGDTARVFGAGGDGTLYDIVNGAAGFDNLEIGIIPCGSGNDFVKSFGKRDDFLDISSQVNGNAHPLDLIKYGDKYSLNISSLGMDAEVVNHQHRLHFVSKFSGSLSYTLAVFTAFIFNLNSHFRIVADGEEFDGKFLFVVAANGRYYGGGFNPTPDAILNDGNIQMLLINEVSRFDVVKLMGKYREGKHFEIPGLCEKRNVKHIEVFCDKEMSVQLDGEVFRTEHVVYDIVPSGIKFIIPASVTPDSISAGNKTAEMA